MVARCVPFPIHDWCCPDQSADPTYTLHTLIRYAINMSTRLFSVRTTNKVETNKQTKKREERKETTTTTVAT